MIINTLNKDNGVNLAVVSVHDVVSALGSGAVGAWFPSSMQDGCCSMGPQSGVVGLPNHANLAAFHSLPIDEPQLGVCVQPRPSFFLPSC